jgi:alanyl-tRNA synthetase
VVLTCSPEPGRNAGELLRSALSASGGRGGGSATLAQGLVPADQLTAVLDAVEAMLRPKAVPAV